MSAAILKPFWPAIALGCAALGCASPNPEAIRGSEQALVGGQPSGSDEDGVLEVWGNADTVINKCTGSLIAENLVLTARHCVAYYVDDSFSCSTTGELMPGSKGGQIGATLAPAKISIHLGSTPSKVSAALGSTVFATAATSICRNDIALVLLDRPLTGLPLMSLRLLTGDTPGEPVRFIGYGATELGSIATRTTLSGLSISQIGSSEFRPQGDPIPPRTLVTEGPAGCPGDSGGPLLSGKNAILGVFTQVTGTCTAKNARDFFTQVAPFNAELFQPAFAAANAKPMLEGDAGPLDEGGAGGAASAGDTAGAAGAGGASDAMTPGGAGLAGVANEPADADPHSGGCALARVPPGVGRLARDANGLLALLAAVVAHRRRRRARPL